MKTRFASYGLMAALSISIVGCASPATSPSASGKASTAESSTGAKKAEGSADAGTSTGGAPAAAPTTPTTAARGEATTGASKPATSPVSNNAGGMISNNGADLIGKGAGNLAPMPAASAAPASEASSDMGAPGFAVGEPNPGMPAPPTQEALKAGAVDDNAKYKDYLEYLADFDYNSVLMPPRKLDISERHIIRVVDAGGKGVSNADVTIKVGETVIAEAKTYADGRTLFHPSAYSGLEQAGAFTVSATKGALVISEDFQSSNTADWEVNLTGAVEKPSAKLDMAIVIDTTGSMGGEIKKFQQTFSTIATRLQALPQQPSVRFGLVAYKDQREQYVSKVASPFTSEVGQFQSALNLLSPGGGGDKPEDLEAGLSDTMNTLAWDSGETVRLSFVVTDAAIHSDYPQSTPYTDSMQLAAKKGIKIYPVGASSLESEGEYALRQLAQWTMAKYLFVTRGGDEATGGGGTASATVDAFREGRLDDIIVDIVKAELDKLGQ